MGVPKKHRLVIANKKGRNMLIHEYGSRDDPTIILLAPMMVSGNELYQWMKPFLKGSYHVIAPDQGGHGGAGAYHSG